jgi:hypothetical protein
VLCIGTGQGRMKIEFYIDPSRDDLTRYIAKEDNALYEGRFGMRGDKNFLKFVLTRRKEDFNKFKKVSPEQLQMDVQRRKNTPFDFIDFKKLYQH